MDGVKAVAAARFGHLREELVRGMIGPCISSIRVTVTSPIFSSFMSGSSLFSGTRKAHACWVVLGKGADRGGSGRTAGETSVRTPRLLGSGNRLRTHAGERGLGDLGILQRSTARNTQTAGVSIIEPDR